MRTVGRIQDAEIEQINRTCAALAECQKGERSFPFTGWSTVHKTIQRASPKHVQMMLQGLCSLYQEAFLEMVD
jgi:hypothetical protein